MCHIVSYQIKTYLKEKEQICYREKMETYKEEDLNVGYCDLRQRHKKGNVSVQNFKRIESKKYIILQTNMLLSFDVEFN